MSAIQELQEYLDKHQLKLAGLVADRVKTEEDVAAAVLESLKAIEEGDFEELSDEDLD